MYTVEMEDGRVVRKHSDHLRARTCSSPGTDATDDFGVGDDDADTPATADAGVGPTEPGPTTSRNSEELPSTVSEAPPTEPDPPNVAGPQEAVLPESETPAMGTPPRTGSPGDAPGPPDRKSVV